MKKLLQVSTLLLFFLLSSNISAQAPSGYTTVLNHNFGTSGSIKNVTDLQNNYDWGLFWGSKNPNNPWANAAEWQKYTAFTSNNYAFASNHLKIIARFNNDLNGNGKPDYPGGSNREITSGCLRSKNTYKPTASKSYYFETRMKIPDGKALWPAFWLYREKGGTKAEIDIVEVVNNEYDSSLAPNWTPLVYHNNVHFSNSGDNAFGSAKGSSLSSGYHIWACEWTSTQVKFYLDNNLIRTVSYPINNPSTGWGDSKPANVLINLAAGGGWPGPADDKNAFPATLEVDYLRIYEKGNSSGTDEIISTSGPTTINPGQSVTVAVKYKASTSRKIKTTLQLGEAPWTEIVSASKNVSTGSGTVNLTFTAPSSTPLGTKYQYQTIITKTNGGWNERLHDKNQFPITVSNNSGGTDEITSISSSSSIKPGQTVTVSVAYKASSARSIQTSLHLDKAPWTWYAGASKSVNAGSGTVDLTFTIPSNIPVGSNYMYQNIITTSNGDWRSKIHNKIKRPITVSNNSGGTDEITSISSSSSIKPGQTVTVSVAYKASSARSIQTSLHLDKAPWTWYAGASKSVNVGSGTVDLTFTIPSNIPVGSNYMYQNIITTSNGDWRNKIHNKIKRPITVTNNGGGGDSGYRYLKYTVTNASNHKMLELSWLAGSTNYPQTNLSSNTSGSGVTVSGSFGSDSYKAFDGDLSGPNGLWIGDQTPKHILLDFGLNKISPTKINIQKKSWSNLKGFKCEGSNNGSNWTVLYNNTSSAGTWTNKTFTFTASKSAVSKTTLIESKSSIYPNPSSGLFNFRFSSTYSGEASIKIFSIDGRQIKDLKLQKKDGVFTYPIDLSNHASGIYTLNFEAGDYQSNHKIIKN